MIHWATRLIFIQEKRNEQHDIVQEKEEFHPISKWPLSSLLGYLFLPHCARACQHVISLLSFPFYKFVCDTLIRLGEFALNVINCPLNVSYKNSISSLVYSLGKGALFWNSLTIKYNSSEETCLCKKCYSIIFIFLFDTKRHAQFYPIYIIDNAFLLHVVHGGILNLHAGVKLILHQPVFFQILLSQKDY